MLHRLGVDALDTGAWAILVVQLAHRLGWASWSAEDLDSALEVDPIARRSTSVKSLRCAKFRSHFVLQHVWECRLQW
jgi:hypothetical protein